MSMPIKLAVCKDLPWSGGSMVYVASFMLTLNGDLSSTSILVEPAIFVPPANTTTNSNATSHTNTLAKTRVFFFTKKHQQNYPKLCHNFSSHLSHLHCYISLHDVYAAISLSPLLHVSETFILNSSDLHHKSLWPF